LQQRDVVIRVTQKSFVPAQDKPMHVDIIGNLNLVGSIAVFAIMHGRHALAFCWDGLWYFDDYCCFFVAVETVESQFFLSHASLPPAGLIRQVAHGMAHSFVQIYIIKI